MAMVDDSLSHRQEQAEALAGVSLVFGLLGRALYGFPDREWLQSLADQDPFEEIPFGASQPDIQAGLPLLRSWAAKSRGGMKDGDFELLKADHLRLLIGVETVEAPPWESVHLSPEHLLFQEETWQVRLWYRRFGLEPANLHKEPDDHVGLELTFVAHLAALALDALDRRDSAAFDELLQAQRRFLAEHLLRWVPSWCELLRSKAGTDFYRGIALVTGGAVKELARLLDIKGGDIARTTH